jgi:uncharacterized OsmC-like protein
MNPSEIKELFDRKASAMARRPAFARGVGQARIRMTDGMVCDVDHGDRTFRVDQPASEGGGGAGPHPGQLMRASLGACLAMGYRIWSARLGVAIDAVEVEMTCEYDARGQMGVSEDVAVGWQQVRFDVRVTSAAPEDDVRRVVATADRLSPMLANLAPAVRRLHHLTIVRPEGY